MLVGVPVTLGLRAAGIFGNDPDPLVVLLSLIEPAMPAAQTLVVLLNMEGLSDAAGRLGAAYVVQVRGHAYAFAWGPSICATICPSIE